MTTLYLTEPRSVVQKDGETLIVKIPANKESGSGAQSDARSVRIPLLKISQVVVLGDSTVTTPALLALLDQNADVCFCNFWGKFQGRLAPQVSKNVFVRTAQFRCHEEYRRRVALAARFVRGKLHNQRTLLLRSNRGLNDPEIENWAATIRSMIDEVDRLIIEEDGPPNPSRPQEKSALGILQGMEGAAASAFFSGFGRLLKQEMGFGKRIRRPPTDPVNSLLSFGYVLLMNNVLSAVGIVGFDPYVGFLHSEGYGKPALALDLMEEMRTPVVDSVVLTVVNKQILRPEHFENQFGACQLTTQGRKLFLQQFEARLNTEIQHPEFGYKASYRRCLELQARLLAKYLTGEVPVYRPFQVR